MQIENNSLLSGIQSLFQVSPQNSKQVAVQPVTQASLDKVSISPEAKALYEQSMVQKQSETKEQEIDMFKDEVVASLIDAPKDSSSTEKADGKTATERFRDVLQKHINDLKGSSDDSSGDSAQGGTSGAQAAGGSGGASSSSSDQDAIEKLEQQIEQLTAEIATAASEAVNTGSQEALSRVDTLRTKLSQLEAQLSELMAAMAQTPS